MAIAVIAQAQSLEPQCISSPERSLMAQQLGGTMEHLESYLQEAMLLKTTQ